MWNELRTELNVGQFLDILGSVRRERRLEKAERIARYKSGKYTIERPLHLGALLATPADPDTTLEALSRFGLPLGDAFQMRDDVIGVYGDPHPGGGARASRHARTRRRRRRVHPAGHH
jgi:geranylgeranyl diphosphate synthase type I